MKVPIKRYIKLLSKYLKPQGRNMLLLGMLLAANIILQLINPQIVSYFIDSASKGGSTRALTAAALVFMAAAIIQQGLNIWSTYLSQNIGWSSTNTLRRDLVEKCISLDMDFHKEHQPGALIERVDGDVTALFNLFSRLMLNVLNNVVLMIGILVLLFIKDWRIGASISLFAALAMYILWRTQAKAVPRWVEERKISAEFYGFIGEQISSTEDIRSLGAVNYVMNKFYKLIKRWLPIRKKAAMMSYVMWVTTILIFAAGNAVAFGIGGYLWSKGAITIGTVYLVFYYTGLLEKPIEQIRRQLEDLQRAGASIARIEELLSLSSRLPDGNKSIEQGTSLPVCVKNICFEYDEGVPVLKDISFSLQRGKILGVLGRTGSGKTTLARLLVRLYDPAAGEIYIGNTGIKNISNKDLRSRIAYVTQDVQLFHATVRDNLTFFDDSIKDNEILNILGDMGLNEWYSSLSNGLDTVLEAGGTGLSSGEAQLLAFVRVFLKSPSVIILDEASSRLDPATERLMEKALNRLLEGRTCIIIAHRLQTLKRADDILILDNGEIIEYGNREELECADGSHFHRLLKTGMEEVLV